MRAIVALATRLAVGSDAAGRRRSIAVALAAAVGTTAALMILAFARADRVVHPERYADGGMGRLVAVVIAVVGLQVAALAAAAGRLSAVVRARRLANLRLLGLTAARTRLVSAVEVGLFAGVGAIGGIGVFAACRPVLARVNIAGQRWPEQELQPGAQASVAVAAGCALLTIGLAVLPDRLDQTASWARVRRASTGPPSLWRLVPLAVGAGLCLIVLRSENDEGPIAALGAGVVSLGIGLVLVVPVFVRLVAVLLQRFARGPVLLVAARRLQAQPAGMNRVVAGLLVGLFVVTGARSVVTAFESASQYRGAAIGLHDRQSVSLGADADDVSATVTSIRAIQGVRSVTPLPELTIVGCDPTRGCPVAVVATCEEFATVYPSAEGCVPDEVQWIRQYEQVPPEIEPNARWSTRAQGGASMRAEPVRSVIDIDELEPLSRGHGVRIPPDAIGVGEVVAEARYTIAVVGDPGRDLPERLRTAGFEGAFAPWDPIDYDFVATLRALANAVAVLVLALGLAAFAISAIDRAADRRRDVAGLLLIGAPRALLRRTQWIESAVPIVGGGVLAVLLGLLAGTSYLSVADGLEAPIGAAVWLAIAAAIGGLLVAGLTVIAASPSADTQIVRRA